jgi:hypothetical protein
MKKILVLLLILAVAGGVFALDGEWAIDGKVEVGGTLDFGYRQNGKFGETADHKDITALGEGYNRVYGGWGGIDGKLGLTYLWDAVKIGIELHNALDGDPISGDLSYNGESFQFQATTNLARLISGDWDWWNTDSDDFDIDNVETWFIGGRKNSGRLWGSYKLLNGLVLLETAYKGRDTEWWISDKTAAFGTSFNAFSVTGVNLSAGDWGPIGTGPWPGGDTFSKGDGDNYLVTNVMLENLEFGIKLPNVFAISEAKLIDNVLKKTIIGVSFNMQPVELAAQFSMGEYGAYFGLIWSFGPLKAGLSFMGILKPDLPVPLDETKLFKFGGGLDYNADSFSAGVHAYFATIGNSNSAVDSRVNQIGIEPTFSYNVIPTHLMFQLDAGFYLNSAKLKGKKFDSDIAWAVQPQLFWNFMGTGAGGYYGFNTGMIVRYRLVGGAKAWSDDGAPWLIKNNNKLDVTFKFAF